MIIYKADLNNKSYIGITKDFEIRKKEHIWSAKTNSPYYFHKAIRKYGVEEIKWSVLTEGNGDTEQFYIALFDTYNNGYNQTLGGEAPMLGKKHSKETINKFSLDRAGKKNGNWKGYWNTPLGKFDTIVDAMEAHKCCRATIQYKVKSDKDKWKEYNR